MASVFTRIIRGELPCYQIAEDEWSFSFLSIDPVRPGHTLVIPKEEVDHWVDCRDPYYQAVFTHAKRVAPAIQRATDAQRIGAIIQGFEVPHFHLHLIPARSPRDLDLKKSSPQTPEQMESIAQAIRRELVAD